MLRSAYDRLGNKDREREVAHAPSRSSCAATANQDKQRRLSNKREVKLWRGEVENSSKELTAVETRELSRACNPAVKKKAVGKKDTSRAPKEC